MPVLHKYKDKENYFVLTSISGKVVTFQLTSEGMRRLKEAGIVLDQTFERALLLDLYRSGEAFTGSKSSESRGPAVEVLQLEFDFTDDPEPESMFPACALCAATDDLHLVEIKNRGNRASILCPQCRIERSAFIDSSLPLPLVSRGILSRFLAMKGIKEVDDTVAGYRKLLEAEFDNKWKVLMLHRPVQESLWDLDGQKKLF
jgi:hypothetical protein